MSCAQRPNESASAESRSSDLRRTFAMHFHGVGTVKDQQMQIRHKTAQVTMNAYTQSMSDSLQTAVEDFDREMSRSEAAKTSKDSEHQ
jgi:integrase